MLGGIGEINDKRQPNFLIVKKDTSRSEIEETFNQFMKRNDIAIILINQYIADEIRHLLDENTATIPSVLEIPSKEHPYDPSKDSILRRAKGMFNPDDFR
jgi:V-type H+-transporting ATPase subunit F